MSTPIATIKKLNVGTKGLEASGCVKYEAEPKNISGEKNGKPYSFWKQFVVLEDETDSIGCSIQLDRPGQRIEKGRIITVERGALDSYEKDGETKISLQCRLKTSAQTPKEAEETTNKKQTKTKEERISIERQACVKAAARAYQGFAAELPKEELGEIIEFAKALHYFVETGSNLYQIPDMPDEPAPPRQDGHTPPEQEDDIPPF